MGGRNLWWTIAGGVVGVLITGVVFPVVIDGEDPPAEVSVDDGLDAGRRDGGGTGDDRESGQDRNGAGTRADAGGAASDALSTARTAGREAGSPGDVGAAGSGSGLTASARGVTSATIKVGLLILQVGQVEQIGFAVGASVEEQRAAWNAFVDDVNRNGGILGRKLEPVFAQYDALDYDTLRAACLALTKDANVFAVLDGAGTFFGPTQLCVTDEHGTPLLSVGAAGSPDEYFQRSGGRLFSFYMRGSRMMQNFAEELHRAKRLEGRTLGLIADERSKPTIDFLIAELARRGYRITHRTNFSEDTGTAVSQVPIEVQQMRSKGVDTVLLAGNVVAETQFVQAADGQRWHPQYLASDWSSNSQDAAHQNQPASFDGALAITVRRSGEHLVGRPEPAVEVRCRQLYERATGQKLQRGAINTSLYTLMCSTLEVFVAGARNAGAELTTASLTGGIERIGRIALSNMGDGEFRPGKHDAGLEIRTNRWTADCRCWKPTGEFRGAPF